MTSVASTLTRQPLRAGTRLGPYEIVGLVGEGGMGEVYRARDTRLERDVAVKILPSHLSDDANRRERFMREAWVLSSLNHPHVCAIHDVGEWEGRAFIVMEYVEGERLDARLARRPLPIAKTLWIGGQIADALDAAHRRGFVHRDLKPSNIIVTESGVKLLDFGIAKLWSEPLEAEEQSKATTASDAGAVPGTTAYIAPEQLEGRPADPRSDLFALGVVLFEMLSGRRPFEADSKAGLIAAILEKPPAAITAAAGQVPPALERLILKCLEKNPDLRWQTARDLSSELAWIAHQHEQDAVAHNPVRTPRWASAALALIALAAIGAAGWMWLRQPAAAAGPAAVRFIVNPPNGVVMAGSAAFALSPDGRYIVFAGSSDGGPSLLWIQALDSYTARKLPGTDDAWHPFWSPDSRSVAFFAGQKLKAVDVRDGAVRTLADLPQSSRASQGAWGDGVLLVTGGASAAGASLLRVAPEGGDPVVVPTGGDSGRPMGFAYKFLPDGRHYIFRTMGGSDGAPNIMVGSLDDERTIPILAADSQAEYVDPGYLLFMRSGDLLAQRFDPKSFTLSRRPIHVPEPVAQSSRLNRAIVSASRSGVLAYEAEATMTQLVWFDRYGRRLGVMGAPDLYANPALSPDGSKALVARFDPSVNTSDIWLVDQTLGGRAVTSGPGTEDYPVWSADGRRLIFSSDRSGSMRMYERRADVPATTVDDVPVMAADKGPQDNWPMDWSGSGNWLLFQGGGGVPRRLLAWGGASPREPIALFSSTPSALDLQEAAQAQVSPDGRWIAYVAGLGRSPQVHVKSFDGGEALAQVSSNGGFEPKWRGDGRELFYLAPDRTLMSVAVTCTETCAFGPPRPLFRVAALGAPLRKGSLRNEYAVTRDGSRFLVNEPIDGVSAYAIRVVVNWPSIAQP